MKQRLICHKFKGFLIIELLVALGLLATAVLSIFQYQLQIGLYKKAAEQLYTAISLCEDSIEELWAGKKSPENRTQTIQNITLTSTCLPGPAQAYYQVQISACWTNILNQKQTIKLDAICVA